MVQVARTHQRTQFTHRRTPVTRQAASSIMHFGRACKFDSRFCHGRPQAPLPQLPARTLLCLRWQSLVLTDQLPGKNHGSCTPCICSSAFHARKRSRSCNHCIRFSPFHARKYCCPRNPCIGSSAFHARKCCYPHNPCMRSSASHARKCCCPHNPCMRFSPFHAHKC